MLENSVCYCDRDKNEIREEINNHILITKVKEKVKKGSEKVEQHPWQTL